MWNNLYYDKNKNLWIKEGDNRFRNVGLSIKSGYKTSLDGKSETYIQEISLLFGKVTSAKIDGQGPYSSEEIIAKLHVCEDSPIKVIASDDV